MKPENNPLLDFQSPITQLNNIFPNNNVTIKWNKIKTEKSRLIQTVNHLIMSRQT